MLQASTVEQSAISRSTSEHAATGVRHKLMLGKAKNIDGVFPLIDQMCQHTNIPHFIYSFISYFFYIQIIFTSNWPNSIFWTYVTKTEATAINLLMEICWFNTKAVVYNDLLIITICFVVIFVICFVYLCSIIFYFRQNHRFITWTLYPARIIIECVSPILFHPAAALVGNSFLLLYIHKDSRGWYFMILGAIVMIGFVGFFAAGFMLSSRSACITLTPYSMFEPNSLIVLVGVSASLLVISFFTSIFANWLTIVLQMVHLFCFVYVIWMFSFFPFHRVSSTVIGVTVCLTGITLDLLYVGLYFYPTLDAVAVLSTLGACFIVWGIVCHFYFNKQLKKTARHLNGGQMADEEKLQRFTDLDLTYNEKKALMHLHVGFTQICDRFCDWSLMKFIVANHPTNNALMSCIQCITYFPGESRQLNALFFNATNMRNLTFADRFLIYQVYRIKTLRQSSASVDANERLSDLKAQGANIEAIIRGFWLQKESTLGYFEMISTKYRTVNGLWQEAIRDYPNNAKFSEEYSRFLVETVTDFDEAIIQKQRANLIEMGINFSIDLSFRSLARAYPSYIKNGIIDIKGNFKQAVRVGPHGSTNNTTTTNSSNDKDSTMGTSMIEIDAELEESIGKTILRQSKMRIALHHAIDNHTTTSIKLMPYATLLTLVVSLAAFLALYFYMNSAFQERGTSMKRFKYLSNSRFYVGISSVALYEEWLVWSNFLGGDQFIVDIRKDDALALGRTPFTYISLAAGNNYTTKVMHYKSESAESFSRLMDDLGELSANSVDVYSLAYEMMNPSINAYICNNPPGLYWDLYDKTNPSLVIGRGPLTQEAARYKTNIKNGLVVLFYALVTVTNSWKHRFSDLDAANPALTQDYIVSFISYPEYCELYLTAIDFAATIPLLYESFARYQYKNGEDLSQILTILTVAIPIAIVIFTTVPSGVLGFLFARESNKLGEALLSFDAAVKNESKIPIHRDCDEEELDTPEPKKVISKNMLFNLCLLLLGLCLTGLCIGMILYADSINKSISDLNTFLTFSARRVARSVELLNDILMLVKLADSHLATYVSYPDLKAKIEDSIEIIRANHNNLLQGTNVTIPCNGFDDLLDEYNIEDACPEALGSSELHKNYMCASSDRALAVYLAYANDMVNDPDKYEGNFRDTRVLNIIHIADSHLWHRLNLAQDRIITLGEVKYRDLMQILAFFLAAGIVVAFINCGISIYIRSAMIQSFGGTLSIVKHVPPLQIINNKMLTNLLLNKGDNKRSEGMTLERSIIQNSEDGIIATSVSGVIDICNPANTSILGYTPEQLLGQPLFVIFTKEEQDTITKQMELMRSHQSAMTYEGHTVCVSDHETEIPCHITILGMVNNRNQNIESFVVILRDESLLVLQQKEAEEAKSKSENLLYQILPRDIVLKLNQGEKDISFTVPSASIIFLDIVRFSDYSATLTPEQIMGNLGQIFAAMDTAAAKYPLVMKIKLIGDVYMAASGLFSSDEPPSSHADQIVRFGLDVLQELEDINVKLNANLAMRVGVNSGGPLIAGVLGTDKPVFDIIGDPINIAARLQSTDIPGRIQIPESTHDLIKEMNFEIEERGQVFLKGKGSTMAYFVRPFPSFMSHFSSQDFKASKGQTIEGASVPTIPIVPISPPPDHH